MGTAEFKVRRKRNSSSPNYILLQLQFQLRTLILISPLQEHCSQIIGFRIPVLLLRVSQKKARLNKACLVYDLYSTS